MYSAMALEPTKPMAWMSGIVEDGVDRLLVAVDDVEDALGQAGLDHQFGQAHGHRRVALGRLQDEGVAAGDGRARTSTSGSWPGS
jgi:hypothetical protein